MSKKLNYNYGHIDPETGEVTEYAPAILRVVTHHIEEYQACINQAEVDASIDPETGEPTMEPIYETRTREWDTWVTKMLPPTEDYAKMGWVPVAPPKIPRKWSSLAIKRALEARGLWNDIRTMLEQSDHFYDFLMADYIAEDDDAFKAACAAAIELYGEESVASLLDSIPVEKN